MAVKADTFLFGRVLGTRSPRPHLLASPLDGQWLAVRATCVVLPSFSGISLRAGVLRTLEGPGSPCYECKCFNERGTTLAVNSVLW
ncbi:hypothetical protein KM043_017460 [Ampulex compressa]|nr:hypothetical protein KM043_017460 [Ampulex compressa]